MDTELLEPGENDAGNPEIGEAHALLGEAHLALPSTGTLERGVELPK
jgi:hypothetical protein